jgi:hypothetical protein
MDGAKLEDLEIQCVLRHGKRLKSIRFWISEYLIFSERIDSN